MVAPTEVRAAAARRDVRGDPPPNPRRPGGALARGADETGQPRRDRPAGRGGAHHRLSRLRLPGGAVRRAGYRTVEPRGLGRPDRGRRPSRRAGAPARRDARRRRDLRRLARRRRRALLDVGARPGVRRRGDRPPRSATVGRHAVPRRPAGRTGSTPGRCHRRGGRRRAVDARQLRQLRRALHRARTPVDEVARILTETAERTLCR